MLSSGESFNNKHVGNILYDNNRSAFRALGLDSSPGARPLCHRVPTFDAGMITRDTDKRLSAAWAALRYNMTNTGNGISVQRNPVTDFIKLNCLESNVPRLLVLFT